MKKIYQYFEKLYNEDKISQAFLIGNVVFDDVKSELEETLNSFFFQNNITLEDINNWNKIITLFGQKN